MIRAYYDLADKEYFAVPMLSEVERREYVDLGIIVRTLGMLSLEIGPWLSHRRSELESLNGDRMRGFPLPRTKSGRRR